MLFKGKNPAQIHPYKVNVNRYIVSRPKFIALSNGGLCFPASTVLTAENGG
jgi:hypothetical protein